MEVSAIFETPESMQAILRKQVQIKTVDNKTHTGYVYVIDPQSKTVVLETNEDTFDIILYHAIKDLTLLSEEISQFEFDQETKIANEKDVCGKKKKLKEWLEENLIKVEEDGLSLKVSDHITIVPPYGFEQCYCSNTIILEKFKVILDRMPM